MKIASKAYAALVFIFLYAPIIVMIVSGKWIKAIPSSLVALVGVTALLPLFSSLLEGLTVKLPIIGNLSLNKVIEKIGTIPEAMPTLHIMRRWAVRTIPSLT